MTVRSNTPQAAHWRRMRKNIAAAGAADRLLLLDSVAQDIRVLATLMAKATAVPQAPEPRLDLSHCYGALFGGGYSVEPGNPEWPGRDRIFSSLPGTLPIACAALAVCGFFPPEQAARFADAALSPEAETRVPGLEACGMRAEECFARAWESAVESGKSKRRWLDFFGPWAGEGWASTAWRDAAGVWRTCIVADAYASGAEAFLDRPERESDPAAGLTAVIPVPGGDSGPALDRWRASGWDTASVNADDCLRLYDLFSVPAAARPMAVALVPPVRDAGSPPRRRHLLGEGQLLGELSDEQFNAIMGESVNW